jgi:hypothetical protein
MHTANKTLYFMQLTALAALGFLAIGLGSVLMVLTHLALRPEGLGTAISPWAHDPVLILGITGVVTACLFGVLYATASVLSGAQLWSPRAAILHLALHAAGMAWTLAFAATPGASGLITTHLGTALLAGGCVLAMANIALTAARLNRWDPAQLMVLSALFWLAAGVVTAGAPVLGPAWDAVGDPHIVAETATLFLVVGFVWLALLGSHLKFLQLFAPGAPPPGILSWLGLALINATLLAALPTSLVALPAAYPAIGGLILVASFLVLADKVRLLSSVLHTIRVTHAATLLVLSGCSLTLTYLLLSPTPANSQILRSSSAAIEAGIPRLLLATVAGAFLVIAGTLIPLLVWRIRCLAPADSGQITSMRKLYNVNSQPAAALCLICGSAFAISGTLLANIEQQQLAFLSLVIGSAWQLHAITPAIKVFALGIDSIATTTPTH